MGIFDMDILMNLTRRELDNIITGNDLRLIEAREAYMEQSKMTSYAFNQKQNWIRDFGDPMKSRIIAFGGKAKMDSEKVTDALVNEKLTELINNNSNKGRSMFDNLEDRYDVLNNSVDEEV